MSEEKIPLTAQISSADPSVCEFTTEESLYPGASYNCPTPALSEGSPLLEALFSLEGIGQIWVTENRLTVQKESQEPWPILGKRVAKILRDLLRSGQRPLVAPKKISKSNLEEDIRRRVHDTLEKHVNPSVAGHGGSAEVADVKGTEVYVRMQGGCQGCSSASVTLKQGIERAIFENVPEVTAVLDATDHSAGTNPYYSSESGESPVG